MENALETDDVTGEMRISEQAREELIAQSNRSIKAMEMAANLAAIRAANEQIELAKSNDSNETTLGRILDKDVYARDAYEKVVSSGKSFNTAKDFVDEFKSTYIDLAS